MINAVCDICGRQTAEPHVLRIERCDDLHDDPMFVRVICEKCADIMKEGIELSKADLTTKQPNYASYAKGIFAEYCRSIVSEEEV